MSRFFKGSKDSAVSGASSEDGSRKDAKAKRSSLIKMGLGSKESQGSRVSFGDSEVVSESSGLLALASAALSRTSSKERSGVGDNRKGSRTSGGSLNSGETGSSGGSKERPQYGAKSAKKKLADKMDNRNRKGSRKSTITGGSGKRSGGRKGTNRSRKSGSSGRKSTRQSSKSSRSGSSGDSSSSSDSSEEDLANEDWEELNYDRLPLYLREGRIRKDGEIVPVTDTPKKQESVEARVSLIRVDDKGRLVSGDEDGRTEEDEKEAEEAESPMEEVSVAVWKAGCGMCLFTVWILLCITLLMVYVLRYLSNIRTDVQLIVASTSLKRAEVGVANALQPALQATHTVAMAAHAGLLNITDVDAETVLTTAFATTFVSAPSIKYVQILGATNDGRTLEIRPGQLNNDSAALASRLPSVFKLQGTCIEDDKLLCLGADSRASRIRPSTDYGCDIGWGELSWHTLGELGEPLAIAEWPLLQHLSASMNLSTSGTPGGTIAMVLGIDVAALVEVAATTTSPGGSIYICNQNGTVLAGSDGPRDDRARKNFAPKAEMDETTGDLIYPGFWDLGMVWANAVPKDMFHQGGETSWVYMDGTYGNEYVNDLIGVASVQLGTLSGIAPSAAPALRVVVYAPFLLSVQRILWEMALGAMVLISVPAIVCGMIVFVGFFYWWWSNAYFRCCGFRCCCCRFKRCRWCCKKEAWEGDWDDDD